MLNDTVKIQPAVAEALAAGQSVVALESTIISHGLPWPHNLECALNLEAVIQAGGATPATIGLSGGNIIVGLNNAELERFAKGANVVKVSRRDIATVLAQGLDGATTVAATMICAHLAGIRVFATGGIGGVHRGAEHTFDVSADLLELARTPVAVVCAGAKSILDLPKTLEVLETHGVPVLGYQTDTFPAFYTRSSGEAVTARVDSAEQAAAIIRTRDQLKLAADGGEVIAVPIPETQALAPDVLEHWTAQALAAAEAQGIQGKAVTPFLLRHIADLSEGKTLTANLALVENNARVATEIAVVLAR